jgi:hypothetical protein
MAGKRTWTRAVGVAAMMALIVVSTFPSDVRRIRARDIHPELRTSREAELGLTAGILHDREFVYVLDRSDHAVRVYEKNGRFLKTYGRRGQGPGEFNTPSGFSIFKGNLYIADSGNVRIQILSRDGDYLSSLKLPFRPSDVAALSRDVIAVSYLPSFRGGKENMIHGFSPTGEKLWECLEPALTGDSLFDTMVNRFLILPGGPGEFLAVFKSEQAPMRRFDHDGKLIASPAPPRGLPLKGLTLPMSGGKRKLTGFCWHAAFSDGRLFVLSPDRTEEGDLGPGFEVYVFVPGGPLEAVIELPGQAVRISVDGNRIYAVDADRILRIYRFEGL